MGLRVSSQHRNNRGWNVVLVIKLKFAGLLIFFSGDSILHCLFYLEVELFVTVLEIVYQNSVVLTI